MKRLFVLLLIVLLPLRGWAGDFMGVRMAFQQPAAGQQAAALAAMPPDCPMHAQGGEPSQAGHEEAGAMQNCGSCDLCLPLAAPACVRCQFAALAGEARPPAGVDGFVSAALAPTDKPPIL